MLQAGLCMCFRNCWSTWIFTHNQPKKKNISSELQLCGWRFLADVRGQRGNGQIGDRKATVTPISTGYNWEMQNTVSERTTLGTLKKKKMGYSGRRPHQAPLLSARNRKLKPQFTQTHQNWIEDWNKRLVLTSLDSSCNIRRVGSGFCINNMEAWIHPARYQRFKMLVVAVCVCVWYIIIKLRDTTIEHLWDVAEREIGIVDVQPTNHQQQQLCDTTVSVWTKDLRGTSLKVCHEEPRHFSRQTGVQPFISDETPYKVASGCWLEGIYHSGYGLCDLFIF